MLEVLILVAGMKPKLFWTRLCYNQHCFFFFSFHVVWLEILPFLELEEYWYKECGRSFLAWTFLDSSSWGFQVDETWDSVLLKQLSWEFQVEKT